MAGKPQLQFTNKDFSDPFNAGQMVGMMVLATFIEKNGGITSDVIDKIRQVCATNVEPFFNKPAEDIFLMVDGMVKEIE